MASTFTTNKSGAPRPVSFMPPSKSKTIRVTLFQFLEGTSPSGVQYYEKFTIFLIFLWVATSILSTVFLPDCNTSSNLIITTISICDSFCDAVWFGIGSTAVSTVKVFVMGAFTVDYILRIYTADMIDPVKYGGFLGRLRFMITFLALVDLFSIAPLFIDVFLMPNTELGASTCLRMFRLLRMTSNSSPIFAKSKVGWTTEHYQRTSQRDGAGSFTLHAISAMPIYEHKSFEELRFEDYIAGNRGTKGQSTAAAMPSFGGFKGSQAPPQNSRPSYTGTTSLKYRRTIKEDISNWIILQAITAMPQYEQKSFEELRLEDYELHGWISWDR